MPQMLLVADERLRRSLVGPLEAKGWNVRVVNFLSEIPEECAREPPPEVIAATFPPTTGGHQALVELSRDHASKMLPIIALVPEARQRESEMFRQAGAAAVFAAPVSFRELSTVATSLAGTVRAERERIAAEARREAERLNSIPPTRVPVVEAEKEQALSTEPAPTSKRWRLWAILVIVIAALLVALFATTARAQSPVAFDSAALPKPAGPAAEHVETGLAR